MTPGNKRAGTATRITFLSSNENCLLPWRERSGVAAHVSAKGTHRAGHRSRLLNSMLYS